MNKKYPDFKYWGDTYPVKFIVDKYGRDALWQDGITIVNDLVIEIYGLPREYWRDGKYYFRIEAPYLEYYCYKGQWYSYPDKPLEAILGEFDYYSFPPQKELEAMRYLGYGSLSRHQAERLSYWEHQLDLRCRRGAARLWRLEGRNAKKLGKS